MSKNKLRFKKINELTHPESVTVRIGEVILENPKSKITVEMAKAFSGKGVPFFTSGKSILQIGKHIIDGDNIFMTTGGVAGVMFHSGQCSYSSDTWSFKSYDEDKVSTLYLYYAILSNIALINRELFKGSGLKHLEKPSFKKIELDLPSLPEQKKIAALFSKLDERIELREQKIARLKEYKKGLQQAVFGNNGERTLGFKDADGNDYPDWVESNLGDLASYVNKKDKIQAEDIYVSVSNITNGNYDESIKVTRQSGTRFENNDLLLSNIRPYLKKYMKASSSGIAASDVLVLRSNGKVSPLFMEQMLIKDSFWDYVMTGAKGSKMPRGDKAHILEYSVEVPALEEQEKIANLFSKIDNQIELEEALLQAAKDEKQGLMQRIF